MDFADGSTSATPYYIDGQMKEAVASSTTPSRRYLMTGRFLTAALFVADPNYTHPVTENLKALCTELRQDPVSEELTDGSPLPEVVQEILAPFLTGLDIGALRIHHMPWYVVALSGDADAMTIGNRIYFNEGQYQPNSLEGLALIGHEATHSLQYKMHGSAANFIQRYTIEYFRNRANGATAEEGLVRGMRPFEAYEETSTEQGSRAIQEAVHQELRAAGCKL